MFKICLLQYMIFCIILLVLLFYKMVYLYSLISTQYQWAYFLFNCGSTIVIIISFWLNIQAVIICLYLVQWHKLYILLTGILKCILFRFIVTYICPNRLIYTKPLVTCKGPWVLLFVNISILNAYIQILSNNIWEKYIWTIIIAVWVISMECIRSMLITFL